MKTYPFTLWTMGAMEGCDANWFKWLEPWEFYIFFDKEVIEYLYEISRSNTSNMSVQQEFGGEPQKLAAELAL